MNLETLVITLLSLMVISIAVAVFLNERSKRQFEYRQKMARLRQRSDYIKEIALATESLVDDANIPVQLLFQASALAKQIVDMADGTDPHAQATLNSNLELISRWESQGLNPDLRIIASSNLEVDRYKKHLFEADRILQVSTQIGMLNPQSYQKLHDELAWSTLALEASAHIKQGDEATTSRDLFAAQAHYRHARNNLEASHCKDPRCIDMINEAKRKLDELNELERS